MRLLTMLGIGSPVVLLLLATSGNIITRDTTIGVIQVLLTVSPLLLVLDNYRVKRGQNLTTMATLGSGLICMGAIFLLMGLGFTGFATLAGGIVWSIVAVQSAIYAEPSNTASSMEK